MTIDNKAHKEYFSFLLLVWLKFLLSLLISAVSSEKVRAVLDGEERAGMHFPSFLVSL